MARRLIDSKIVDSDMFLDLPLSSQSLYFHLCLKADDDGFIDNPRTIQRSLGCTNDDLKLLFTKAYIIPFESGIVVIAHWNMHNSIRKDRKKDTIHSFEFNKLALDESKKYYLSKVNDNQVSTICQPNDLLSKDKLSKSKLSKGNKKENKHIYGIYEHVRLTDKEYVKIKEDFTFYQKLIAKLDEYIETSGKTYKNHNLVLRGWVLDWYKENNINTVVEDIQQITEVQTVDNIELKSLLETLKKGEL